MAAPAHSSLFERAITVVPIDSNNYSANLDLAWCIGKEPVGLQISFLRRTFSGPAILTVEEIKLGARVSTIHVTLSQKPHQASSTEPPDGRALEVNVAAYITLSPPNTEDGPVIKGAWNLSPPLPPGSLPNGWVDFKTLVQNGTDGAWALGPRAAPELHAMKHLKIYSPLQSLLPRTLEDHTNQVVDQWAQFMPGGNPAKWSNEAVMYLADIFPAALARMGAMETRRLLALQGKERTDKSTIEEGMAQFWYPTVMMNIDIKTRLPPEGVEWLHSRVVTRMLRGSRADLDVLVLDQNQELIATSAQVSLVVDGSRNSKGRLGPGKL
ncbi:hypothetical protein AnigIFM60653_009929 [Aspergillus niger]|nr:hypothetical protein AnigIFM50267_011807 [Aspergillus niger]GLA08398.1 hypothetical protein AnigIFM60653_009929 [Aspergillus niger]GLA19261.1 hypothetical protein AnigIFM62618_006930 [Aspergillus niger]